VTAPLRVWLVRHGETEGQSSIRYHGQNDVPLSDLGRQQIRALIPLFAGLDPVRIVHSPLSRAAESARILQKAHGWNAASLHVEERLREISFGHCEGMTAEEIAAAHPEFWAQHQRGEADAFPGGESKVTFAARVQRAVHEHAEMHERGDLVIVAHRGIVRQALRALLQLPREAEPIHKFSVSLGSLSVALRSQRWELEMFDFVP
jgi:broad specificity phosphatase PhoE